MELTFDQQALFAFLDRGGPALVVIVGLSILTVAVILWKLWQLNRYGIWSRHGAEQLVRQWLDQGKVNLSEKRPGNMYLGFVNNVIGVLQDIKLEPEMAREETTRLAMCELCRLRKGLRPLDLIATIAPLVGLLGTVLGMIAAFQALQETGTSADPSILAGGIWEALLTTAAGMAVAIPAAIALSWFESVAERAQHDMEDLATRLFVYSPNMAISEETA